MRACVGVCVEIIREFDDSFAEDAVKQEQKEQPNREWVSPVPEVEVGGSAPGGPQVRARKDIPRGARFGPFLGKWASEPFNPRYAWEVSCIPYDTRCIFVTFDLVRKKKKKKWINEANVSILD